MRFQCVLTNSHGTVKGIGGGSKMQRAHIQSNNLGVEVTARPTGLEFEEFDIFLTSGASGKEKSIYIGTALLNELGKISLEIKTGLSPR